MGTGFFASQLEVKNLEGRCTEVLLSNDKSCRRIFSPIDFLSHGLPILML